MCLGSERNLYTIDADILEVLGVILDEFDSISAAEEEDNSLEIQTALLDEILRPLMPPQKVLGCFIARSV
jgi:hypothetical protein